MPSSKLKTKSAFAAVVVTLVGGFEGVRQNAYPDPATRGKPWTVCFGETKNVKRGDHYTLAECKTMLKASLESYAEGVEKCTKGPIPDGPEAAFISFAYNLGVGGYCRSSVRRAWNAGDRRGACNDLLHYDTAAGIVFPGLVRRREAERALCLKSAAQ